MNDDDKRSMKYLDDLPDEELDHCSDLRSSGWLQQQVLTLQLQLHSVGTLERNWQQLCKTTFTQTWVYLLHKKHGLKLTTLDWW